MVLPGDGATVSVRHDNWEQFSNGNSGVEEAMALRSNNGGNQDQGYVDFSYRAATSSFATCRVDDESCGAGHQAGLISPPGELVILERCLGMQLCDFAGAETRALRIFTGSLLDYRGRISAGAGNQTLDASLTTELRMIGFRDKDCTP